MQWPPPRPLSARRVSLPRCRRRGLRTVTGGLNERAGYRWLPLLVLAAVPWRGDHRVTEGRSRFHRRNTRIYTFAERETESLRFTAPHAYARVNVRRRAPSSRPDTARIRETRRRKVFFSGSTRAAESMCDVTLPNCLFWFCGCARD